MIARATLVVVIVMLLQVAASVLFYEAIDRQTIREDHARRVAELLVVSGRLDIGGAADVAKTMSTRHLDVSTTSSPSTTRQGINTEAETIKEQIVEWEPELAARTLFLDIGHSIDGRDHLIGSMQLGEGRWLNFRSLDLSAGWPIALRATIMTVALTLICIMAGAYALRMLGEPLRKLTEATRRVGEGNRVQFVEKGPADLRNLSRSFNEMQDRIDLLVADQAKAFEAISHDLRTPLSRLKIAADLVEDDMGTVIAGSVSEMESMLGSLLVFLRAQHLQSEPELIDLVTEVQALMAQWETGEIHLKAPASAKVVTYREPLKMALRPLIENAIQYGARAELEIAQEAGIWLIRVRDHGSGVSEEDMSRILDPFFRADEARLRNTDGFGLGIPTAHRLLQRFGGALGFQNRPEGGLEVVLTVPRPQ